VRTGRVAIVDPFSTGEYLAAAFARQGLEAVAVVATVPPPERAVELSGDQYAAVIPYEQDTEEIARQLKQLRVEHVIAGSESGILVADRLASRLGAPGNDPSSTTARRDKFAMAEALARAGLPHAQTMRAFSVAGARDLAHGMGRWPLVVKPADSAASDRVTIAHGIEHLALLAADILSSSNIFGRRNETVIVQQYLSGEQYAVNTVSRDGVHRVVEVWHDRRTDLGDGRMIYDRMDLLAPGDPRVPVLTGYVRDCLDALGIAHGPAHSEVMLTAADGPVLIETGARLQGGDSVPLMRAATGTSQTDAAVQAALDSAGAHAARTSDPYPYAPVTQLFLQAPADGWIDDGALEQLAQIPGVAGCVHAPAAGATVRRTVDLLSSPATVYLIADTTWQIDQAHEAVRKLEVADFYQRAHLGR
jgi:biotin carboxylase